MESQYLIHFFHKIIVNEHKKIKKKKKKGKIINATLINATYYYTYCHLLP